MLQTETMTITVRLIGAFGRVSCGCSGCCLVPSTVLNGASLADDAADGENPIVKRKKKLDENFYGIVHIQATFNNTIVNITDVTGATLCW